MNIYITRHGESIGNLKRVVMGQQEHSLTARGKMHAKSKSEKLHGIVFDAVYTSDLARCVETAKIISNTPSHATPRLREISFGVFEGKPYEAMANIEMTDLRTRSEGGESNQDMINRAHNFLDELFTSRSKDSNILIVTHSGTAAAIDSILRGTDFFKSLSDKLNFEAIRLYHTSEKQRCKTYEEI